MGVSKQRKKLAKGKLKQRKKLKLKHQAYAEASTKKQAEKLAVLRAERWQKVKKVITKTVATIITTATLAGAPFALFAKTLEKKVEAAEKEPAAHEYMLKTPTGAVLNLPLNENPIAVVLQNFSDEKKQIAIDAINELDNISKNIDYVILDTDDARITQKIIIQNNVDLEELCGPTVLGVTHMLINTKSGEINYPVSIILDDNIQEIYDENGNSLLEHVLKHEMLHTLGFADLYDQKFQGKTIMFYAIDLNASFDGYTQTDIKNIIEMYDKQAEEQQQIPLYVYVPTATYAYFKQLNKEEDLEM